MPISSRGINGAMRRFLIGTIALTAFAAAAFIAVPHSARAQNLVANPNFTDGLSGYQTSGNVGVYQFSDGSFAAGVLGPGERSPQLPGPFLSPSDFVGMLAQAITTTPGAFYTISFLTVSDPHVEDIGSVTFGDASHFADDMPTTGNGNGGTGPTAADLNLFSFVARATGSTTNLSFVADQGGFLITGLDVEPGPAPVNGGGVASLALVLAGFAVNRVRRRAAV